MAVLRQSSACNLTDLIRRDSSVTVPGSTKGSAMSNSERRHDWQDVVNHVTTLFQTKKMSGKLQDMIDKVKSVKSEVGNNIIDYYQESVLKKGMIILREEVREKSGEYLDKLANCWTVFFCNILPTLQAIFASLPQANGLGVRDISLVYFRDIVVLKTKLDEVIDSGSEMSPRLVQMLLVLQSVHDTNIENYQKLEILVAKTVSPYLSTSILRETNGNIVNNANDVMTEPPLTKLQTPSSERLDPVIEIDTSPQTQSLEVPSLFTGASKPSSTQSSLDEQK